MPSRGRSHLIRENSKLQSNDKSMRIAKIRWYLSQPSQVIPSSLPSKYIPFFGMTKHKPDLYCKFKVFLFTHFFLHRYKAPRLTRDKGVFSKYIFWKPHCCPKFFQILNTYLLFFDKLQCLSHIGHTWYLTISLLLLHHPKFKTQCQMYLGM